MLLSTCDGAVVVRPSAAAAAAAVAGDVKSARRIPARTLAVLHHVSSRRQLLPVGELMVTGVSASDP